MYFDPGTGSLIIQAIIATLAVAGGYLAIAKTKLRNLLSKKKDNDSVENGERDDADDTL